MKNTPTPELVNVDAGTVDTVAPSERDPDPVIVDSTPAVDDKPKRGRPRKTEAERPAPGRPSNSDRLAKSLADQYRVMGTLLTLFAPTAGAACIDRADECAASLAKWSETNAKVRKALERVNTGAGAVSVVLAHAPIALAVYLDVTTSRPAGEAIASGPDLGSMFTVPTFG